jgi:hypothetical protein
MVFNSPLLLAKYPWGELGSCMSQLGFVGSMLASLFPRLSSAHTVMTFLNQVKLCTLFRLKSFLEKAVVSVDGVENKSQHSQPVVL